MKKYLLLLITFLASFIFFNNVKADVNNVNINYYTDINDYIFDDYILSSDLLNDYIKDNNFLLSYQHALEYFQPLMNDELYDYVLFIKNSEFNLEKNIYLDRWLKTDNVIPYFTLINYSSGIQTKLHYLNLSSKVKRYEYSLVNDSFTRSTNFSFLTNYLIRDLSNQEFYKKNNLIILDTTKDIIYKKHTTTNYSYVNNFNLIDNKNNNIVLKSFNQDDVFIDKDIISNGFLKKTYTYEENIECRDKSKIIINFKPTEEDLKIQFESHFSEHLINEPTLIYEGETTYSYKFNDYIGDRFPLDAQDLYGNELYSYNGTYEGILGPSSLSNFNNIKIEIDLSGYGDYIYYLKFESNLEYNIEFEYITDTIDYFKTISMDNIYGLYLIPKTLNQDLISNITMYGIYNIEIRDTGKDKENPDIIETLLEYNNSNFQYRFEHAYINYLIFFENNQYNEDKDEGYYITFDTRQFNYAIKEGQYDTPTIINPNTGENIIISSIDNINKKQDISSFMDFLIKNNNIEKFFENFNNIYKKFKTSKQIGQYLFLIVGTSIIILYIKVFKK